MKISKRIPKVFIFFIFLIFFNINSSIPKISIITSLYKGGKFIEGFLKNITKQTIFDQCELIIIDANSPENEQNIIKNYLKSFPNIIYKRLDKVIGIYQAWNMGIKLAKGQYATNANVDDRLAFNCYEKHSKVLDETPSVDLVYSDCYVTIKANDNFETCSKNLIIRKPEFSKEINKIKCLPTFNPMWRKSMHDKFGFFDESLFIIGDSEFWIRAVKNGSLFKKVHGIYGLYYKNPNGLSTDKKKWPLIVSEWKYIRNKHKDFFN